MLKRTPFASTNKVTLKQKTSPVVVIEEDEKEKSKFAFLFSDPANNSMTVRQENGTLRTASRQELYWRDNRKPNYRHCA